jgi:hypothetical protein
MQGISWVAAQLALLKDGSAPWVSEWYFNFRIFIGGGEVESLFCKYSRNLIYSSSWMKLILIRWFVTVCLRYVNSWSFWTVKRKRRVRKRTFPDLRRCDECNSSRIVPVFTLNLRRITFSPYRACCPEKNHVNSRHIQEHSEPLLRSTYRVNLFNPISYCQLILTSPTHPFTKTAFSSARPDLYREYLYD